MLAQPLETCAHKSIKCPDGSVLKYASFKYTKGIYGCLANTTDAGQYPTTQTVIDPRNGTARTYTWPSSEQTYHALKLIALIEIVRVSQRDGVSKSNLIASLFKALDTIAAHKKGEFLPRQHWDGIVYELQRQHSDFFGVPKPHGSPGFGRDFVTCYGYRRHDEFMRLAIRMKADQNPSFKALLMQMAREGVIPVEVSQHDATWATGKDGKGKNNLGIFLYELGCEYLGIDPTGVVDKFNDLKGGNPQLFSHDTLEPELRSSNPFYPFAAELIFFQIGDAQYVQGPHPHVRLKLEDSGFIAEFRKQFGGQWQATKQVNKSQGLQALVNAYEAFKATQTAEEASPLAHQVAPVMSVLTSKPVAAPSPLSGGGHEHKAAPSGERRALSAAPSKRTWGDSASTGEPTTRLHPATMFAQPFTGSRQQPLGAVSLEHPLSSSSIPVDQIFLQTWQLQSKFKIAKTELVHRSETEKLVTVHLDTSSPADEVTCTLNFQVLPAQQEEKTKESAPATRSVVTVEAASDEIDVEMQIRLIFEAEIIRRGGSLESTESSQNAKIHFASMPGMGQKEVDLLYQIGTETYGLTYDSALEPTDALRPSQCQQEQEEVFRPGGPPAP